MRQLIVHYWKEKVRSPFWQKSIFLNILLGFVAIYLILNFIALSLFADKILLNAYPNQSVIFSFSKILFYYFLLDIVFRFFMQQLPVISIQPYLTLPIRKRTLLHFPLIRSVFSFFNLLGLVLIIPFFIKVIASTETVSYSLCWLITVISLIFINNFINFLLKKYFSKKPLVVIVLVALIGLLLFMDVVGTISISTVFANFLSNVSLSGFWVLVPLATLFFFYYLAYALLKNNAYIESPENKVNTNIGKFRSLSNKGVIGSLIGSELKLILRNKRPKSVLYLSAFFLLYGFIFYNDLYLDKIYMLALVGLFVTSTLAIFYYQFVFSWESSFFDTFLVQKISANNFVASKYYLFALMCTVSYLITLPYAFINYKIAIVNTAMFLFNVGISSIVIFYSGTFSVSFIDLGKSQFMNYQGTGAHHFIMMIPLFGLPLLIIWLFDSFGMKDYGIYALGIIGALAIIFHKYCINFVSHQLVRQKYRMACGFRE